MTVIADTNLFAHGWNKPSSGSRLSRRRDGAFAASHLHIYVSVFFFFRRYILAISNGIDEPGEIRLPLATTLLIAWAVVYFCLYKGIKSSGKVSRNQAHLAHILMQCKL